jgi:hypothetical protein
MKQAIPVKWKHVNEGQMTDCKYCPIALALSEFYNYVWVSGAQAMIGEDWDARCYYKFDEQLSGWVLDFDSGAQVQPMVLVLDHKARTAEMLSEVEA